MGPDTSAHYSCSATLNGEFFVFGGSETSQIKQVMNLEKKTNFNNRIQISKIVGCTLKRIGQLPSEFHEGACGTFIFDGHERVMFCFPLSGKDECFR